MEQIYELQGDRDKAIEYYKRVLACLKEDYSSTTGESIDRLNREIDRLEKEKIGLGIKK
jgi:DNA-binding SARP family transcriptional activator